LRYNIDHLIYDRQWLLSYHEGVIATEKHILEELTIMFDLINLAQKFEDIFFSFQ